MMSVRCTPLLIETILLLLSVISSRAFLTPSRSAPRRFGSSPAATLPVMRRHNSYSNRLCSTAADDDNNDDEDEDEEIDLGLDERLYRVRINRVTGIEWGTDLSFSFVYVREMDPSGDASLSGEVTVGDQLCELRPVVSRSDKEDPAPRPTAVNLLGAPFDFVMSTFAELDKNVKFMDLVFFRGSKVELKAACSGDSSKSPESETVTITVIENKGGKDEFIRQIVAPAGCNVRQILTDNQINVYQSVTRWTNCKGKQLCGTCIVNVTNGSNFTNRKSMDEGSTLRENPDSYRLSCVTFAYGDVTVETFPPINAAQWTR